MGVAVGKEIKVQAEQELAPSAPAVADAEAFNRRPAELKVLDLPNSEREAIDLVMKEMVAHGLMEISFLNSGCNGGGDFRRLATIAETLASYSGAVASIYAVNAVFGGTFLALLGNSAHKARFLPDIKAGKCQVAFALTEPEAGSDASSIRTVAAGVPGGSGLTARRFSRLVLRWPTTFSSSPAMKQSGWIGGRSAFL